MHGITFAETLAFASIERKFAILTKIISIFILYKSGHFKKIYHEHSNCKVGSSVNSYVH